MTKSILPSRLRKLKSALTICGLFFSAISFSQTTIVDSIFVGGMYREYRVYVPAIYNPANAVPLVLNLHGYTSNNAQQEIYGDFRPIADTANFIIVHPNGTYDIYNNRYWNCFNSPGNGVDDLGFLTALIDTISAAYTIDANRIYSTGISNGGFMSADLACFLSNRITAIASVAAGMSAVHRPYCNPQHPTPVMEIHGTTDAVVPYNGATGEEPVDTVIHYWVQKNNCGTSPAVTTVPDVNSFDGCTAANYLYSGGNMGSTVELYKITNGGHTWPGAVPVASLGNTNEDFSASREIWRFFRKYKLNTLTAIKNNSFEELSVSIYPNPFTDVITIQSSKNGSVLGIKIVDVMGKEISLENVKAVNGSFEINTSAWANGIYFVSVDVDGKMLRKVVVK